METRTRKQAQTKAASTEHQPMQAHAHPTAAEVVHETVEVAHKVVERVTEKLTCMWDELEEWQQDNHFIISGYRPATASYLKSLKSLSYWHNESVNIYTHLLGAIFFSILSSILYYILAPRYPTANVSDIAVFSAFFVGCLFCLGMSAFYHAVSNHSHEAAKMWNVLDYVGIVGLITGSFIPSVYYGFLCEETLRKSYWGMICSIGIGCATVSVHPHFRTPKYRPFRTMMFVAMGLSAVFPIFHGLYLYGLEEVDRNCGLRWLVAEGVAYIFGAGLYAARIPERWRPGTFDIVGASHQIFHILVLVGAGCHLKGMVVAFDHAHMEGLKCGGVYM
ncbi:hypothetical protein ABW19_dt0203388 [Dactylella cylindrospora]|nr:hypothetical protein ABW19_dt0203388 [Dactylella cylindrospora]